MVRTSPKETRLNRLLCGVKFECLWIVSFVASSYNYTDLRLFYTVISVSYVLYK